MRAVVVDARGVDDADAAQEAQCRIARLRKRRLRPLERLVAGSRDERSGRAVALPETGAPVPGRRAVVRELALGAEALLDLRDEVLRAVAAAGDVVAHVDDAGRARLEREER